MQLECAHNGAVSSRQAGDLIENNLCIVSVLPSCAVGIIITTQAHAKNPNTSGKEGIYCNSKAAERRQHVATTESVIVMS